MKLFILLFRNTQDSAWGVGLFYYAGPGAGAADSAVGGAVGRAGKKAAGAVLREKIGGSPGHRRVGQRGRKP